MNDNDKKAIARLIVTYFFDVLGRGGESGKTLTEENAEIVTAMKEYEPDLAESELLQKFACMFAEGVDAGIEIAMKSDAMGAKK